MYFATNWRQDSPRCWFIFLALLLFFSAGEAHAQLRYAGSLGVRGTYNSNVFAGQAGDFGDDFVTELEPALSLRLDRPVDQLALTYTFALQLYNRAEDPETGDKLLGYTNRLELIYLHQFSQRTNLTLTERVVQGTENNLVQAAVDAAGNLQPGIPLSSSAFVANWIDLGLAHDLSQTWSISTGVAGNVRRVYGLDQGDGALPHQYGVAWTGGVGWAWDDQGQVALGTTVGWGGWQTEEASGEEHPLLHQVLGTVVLDLRWQFTEVLTTTVGGGLAWRLNQAEVAVTAADGTERLEGGEMSPGLAPVARAGLYLQLGPGRTLFAGYGHAYRSDVLIGGNTTTGQDDTAYIRLDWRISSWLLHGGGTYSYLRFTTEDPLGAETEGALHMGGAEVGITVALLRGLEAQASYRFDLLEEASADAGVNILEYRRHMVGVGLTITWPPPPAGDVEPLIPGFSL